MDNGIISITYIVLSFSNERSLCLFFLVIAMYGIVDWSKNKDLKSIVLSLLGFIGATFSMEQLSLVQ